VDFNVFFSSWQVHVHLKGHELKIYKPRSQLDVRKYFFSIGLLMNGLPGSVIHSNTVNTFKAKIDCLSRNRGYI